VVHSLWVPELTRKIDVIPGRTNRVCEELQRGEVVAVRRKVVEAEPVA
jgi:heme/copper-type cytochrome/quinol oxidase subunit 2